MFLGANIASEKTAAAEGTVGELRHDPFAMLPFCGYNMGDYFGYWLRLAQTAPDPGKLPRLFYVNWFRKNADGKFAWPGFGENIRVLKWIIQRLNGEAEAAAPRSGTCRRRARWTWTAWISARPTWICCSPWTRRPGSRRRNRSPSSSEGLAGTCRPGSGSSTRSWSTVWAEMRR